MKNMTWLIFNFFFTGLMVIGWCYDIDGARNVIAAIVAVFCLIGALSLSEVSLALRRKQGPGKSERLAFVLFVLRFGFFAWFGSFWLCAGLSLIFLLGKVADSLAFEKTEVA